MVIVGNKLDLCNPLNRVGVISQRQVTTDELEFFATTQGMNFYETSAKDGTSVNLFMKDVMESTYRISK